jgi:hypothetical protein
MPEMTIVFRFKVESEERSLAMLKRALRENPGLPGWLQSFFGRALQQVTTRFMGGGSWIFDVVEGKATPDA